MSSSLTLIFFFIINRKDLIIKKEWRNYVRDNVRQGHKVLPNDDRLGVNDMSIEMTHSILMVKGPSAPEFNLEDKTNFGNFYTWSEFNILTFFFFVKDKTF